MLVAEWWGNVCTGASLLLTWRWKSRFPTRFLLTTEGRGLGQMLGRVDGGVRTPHVFSMRGLTWGVGVPPTPYLTAPLTLAGSGEVRGLILAS